MLWGYVTVIISLLVWFLLKETGNNNWQFLWFLLPVIAFPATLWSQRKARKMLKTYIDRVVDYVWTVFGLGAFLVSCTAIFVWKIPILFVILLMMGMGTALTGLIVNTKVVTIGGVLGALLSLGCFYMPGIDQILFCIGVRLYDGDSRTLHEQCGEASQTIKEEDDICLKN